jgi:hypothetical protein
MFRDIKVWHVQTTESDHCCLVIECYHNRRGRQRRGFKYENMWRRELSYAKLVEDSWGDATIVHNLSQLQSAPGWMWVSF